MLEVPENKGKLFLWGKINVSNINSGERIRNSLESRESCTLLNIRLKLDLNHKTLKKTGHSSGCTNI